MPEVDSHVAGKGRVPDRDRVSADLLARMLLLSCLTTALPIPFLREWGLLGALALMAARNGRLRLPRDVLSVAFVVLATWAVAGAGVMAIRVEPFWLLYEEVPCALQVLLLTCLARRVAVAQLDDALGRLATGFLAGGLCLTGLALLLYFAYRFLGPVMDRVFALAGSNRVSHERASLRSDYNAFAVGITTLAAAGAILSVRRRRLRAVTVLLLTLAADLVSDSRRVLLLVPLVVPLVTTVWFGLRRSLLVLGGVIMSAALASLIPIDLPWGEILSPRTAAFLKAPFTSLDGLAEAITRDGMWNWALSKMGQGSPLEWGTGFGFGHMLEIGVIFRDPLEPDQTYGYVHNVLLGTMLTFGAFGLVCLLAVVLGAMGRIWLLRARPSGQVLTMLLASGLVMGFWSGNTVFSIPLLAVSLAVSLRVRAMERAVV